MPPFSKPEAVLKQAEGLVSVGQTHAALQSLTEMFSTKKFRSTPLASLEPIMIRFVELCVDMRKGRVAKEGLMQYKNIAQNTSVGSIEVVIKKFVQLADAKVTSAQEAATKATASLEIDDLEASETPESILLGAVSADVSKDRTDRALVTPWLKFLWESYRTALETLKNNARLEIIYQSMAQQAFKFCLKHQRKVEFRRLCETLRLHLSNVAKYSHQPHSINLQDPETLQHHLDTRFAQLSTSIELELWQEAFRSVEDIHNLLTMAKKAPRPAMMANYYEKLTRIFLTSGSALYHAAAWSKYYALVKVVGGKSEEEISKLAGQVLVSALAVPVGTRVEEDGDEGKGRNARLTALLGLTRMPTRTGLLKEALSRGVLKIAPGPVKELYSRLEVTFDPLSLCESITPLFKTLSEDANYAPYLPLLHRALLSRLLSQLAQVYSTVKIDRILELVTPLRTAMSTAENPEADKFWDAEAVEAYVMGCARRGELHIRVHHADGSLTFIDEPFTTDDNSPASATPIASTSSLLPSERPVQPSAAERTKTTLTNVATCLHTALHLISPPAPQPTPSSTERLQALIAASEAERKALQVRRAIVARRRELLSELSARKEKEEASRRAEMSRREKEDEEKRTLLAVRMKEMERAKQINEQIKREEAQKVAERIGVDIKNLDDYDPDALVRMQVEQLQKEKEHLSDRTRIVAKRLDHIERAYRKEERPLLSDDYKQQQLGDREAHEAAQKARIEAARTTHVTDLETKKRLARVVSDYEKYREVFEGKRGDTFTKKVQAAKRKIEEEKAKRKAQVLKSREEERRQREEEERIRREREEEEERLEQERLEEEERIREEEERILEEEAAKKREAEEKAAAVRQKREEERAAAAAESAARLKREEEAAARAEARRLEQQQARTRPAVAPAAAAAVATESPSTWRRSTPTNTTPSTPTRAAAALTNNLNPPSRPESPAISAAGAAPGKFRPPAARLAEAAAAGGGGWRAREAARTASGTASPRPQSPAPTQTPTPPKEGEKKGEDDGFQTVPARNVWRPSRGRGRGTTS